MSKAEKITLYKKLRKMTPQEIAGEIFLRSNRRVRHMLSRMIDNSTSSYISDGDLDRALTKPISEVTLSIREGRLPNLTPGLADLNRIAENIKRLFPDAIDDARRAADSIRNHRITLFEKVFDFGPDIDWHTDPMTGVRWPLEHYTVMQIVRGITSDARVVWELNRMHHLVMLGRAYALTGDEIYTEEFFEQIDSWNRQNPPRFGLNWTTAMEVAIRAINLIAAFEMFRHSPLVTDDRIVLILKMLLAHGRFIRSNLEYSHRVLSNHYLSDLIGLFAIGTAMPALKESDEWKRFAHSQLFTELMTRQVYEDGVSYEGSTGYHRLVTELFTLFLVLSEANEFVSPEGERDRVQAMYDFMRHYLKPDATAPAIGDSDDGRLIKFKDRQSQDHSYMMSMGAILFQNRKFKWSDQIDEEALWWFGEKGLKRFESLQTCDREPGSKAFRNAQIFIQRKENFYSIIDCGDHGINGRGSHAHSDALSIEVFAFDRTFLRDPGTFAYTGSADWRNIFRSTAYHNTVRVDEIDISRIDQRQLFALGENVKPKINLWESNAERDVLDASHSGYATLDKPVTHRRVVTFDKRDLYWKIEDSFTGEGDHLFEFFFNFDAGLEVSISDDKRAVAASHDSALAVVVLSDRQLDIAEEERWVSPSYGTRVRSSAIIFRIRASIPCENALLLIPYKLGDEERIEKLVEQERMKR
jgi:hypothetical protein